MYIKMLFFFIDPHYIPLSSIFFIDLSIFGPYPLSVINERYFSAAYMKEYVR